MICDDKYLLKDMIDNARQLMSTDQTVETTLMIDGILSALRQYYFLRFGAYNPKMEEE